MEKKHIFFAVLVLVFVGAAGCSKCERPDKGPVIARVNDYEITKAEFDEEFANSSFAKTPSPEARREFLNALIDRKLILQDAQAKNIDKTGSFLKALEHFWEQSLLKLALDTKTKEFAGKVFVTDAEIRDAYDALSAQKAIDMPYNKAYDQIKWQLTREKGTRLIDGWVAGLRKKACIKVEPGLLDGEGKR